MRGEAVRVREWVSDRTRARAPTGTRHAQETHSGKEAKIANEGKTTESKPPPLKERTTTAKEAVGRGRDRSPICVCGRVYVRYAQDSKENSGCSLLSPALVSTRNGCGSESDAEEARTYASVGKCEGERGPHTHTQRKRDRNRRKAYAFLYSRVSTRMALAVT